MNSPSQRIWGYETPDGSFAQFARVQSRQLMPRPKHLTWEESACYTLTLATAYRMLFGHRPHILRPGHRSEEHTSELQSLMRISYAVFCLKKKKQQHN